MKLRFGFVSVLLLCLGLCSSCEDERFDTGSTMPDGQFIVDYTAEAGKATRALHENVPAGERINSLTYLLYSEDGMLLKRREVPGLEKDTETWPLTRENMTWEQREALKDTLETNITYHAVFIANIDSTELWNKVSPLKRAGNYDDAYIELPTRAFTDGDMFYYFSKDINSADEGADRDNPYHCDVQLHRIVTRTDFFFEELPEWKFDDTSTSLLREGEVDDEDNNEEPDGDDETGTEGSDGSTEDEGGTELPPSTTPSDTPTTEEPEAGDTPSVTPVTYPEYPAKSIFTEENAAVKTYLLSKLTDIRSDAYIDYLIGIADNTVELLEEITEYLGTIKVTDEDGNETVQYEAEITQIKTVQSTINGDKISFITALSNEDEEKNLVAHLDTTLLNLCAQNTEIKKLWKESVRATGTKGWWAEVAYTDKSGVNQFFLNKTVTHSAEKAPRVEADTIKTEAGITYRGFNLVGFADPTQNIISEIKWYASETAQEAVQTLKRQKEGDAGLEDDPIQTEQGINEKYVVTYRPINELEVAANATTNKEVKVICDLGSVLSFSDDVKNAITEAFKDETIRNTYGESLSKVILTTTLPDLSNPEVLKITPEWKIAEGN